MQRSPTSLGRTLHGQERPCVSACWQHKHTWHRASPPPHMAAAHSPLASTITAAPPCRVGTTAAAGARTQGAVGSPSSVCKRFVRSHWPLTSPNHRGTGRLGYCTPVDLHTAHRGRKSHWCRCRSCVRGSKRGCSCPPLAPRHRRTLPSSTANHSLSCRHACCWSLQKVEAVFRPRCCWAATPNRARLQGAGGGGVQRSGRGAPPGRRRRAGGAFRRKRRASRPPLSPSTWCGPALRPRTPPAGGVSQPGRRPQSRGPSWLGTARTSSGAPDPGSNAQVGTEQHTAL